MGLSQISLRGAGVVALLLFSSSVAPQETRPSGEDPRRPKAPGQRKIDEVKTIEGYTDEGWALRGAERQARAQEEFETGMKSGTPRTNFNKARKEPSVRELKSTLQGCI